MYLCYASEKVDNMVDIVCCHMQGWGIPLVNVCETGYQEVLRESNYYELYERIVKEDYVIIFLTKNLLQDVQALVELDIIKKLYLRHKVKVVALMNKGEEISLPERVSWLQELEIVKINCEKDMRKAVFELVVTALGEEGSDHKTRITQDAILKKLGQDLYVQMMIEYREMSREN